MLLSYAKKGEAGADGPAGPPGRMGDDVRKLLWFLTVTVELIDPASAREGAEEPTSAQSAFIFLSFLGPKRSHWIPRDYGREGRPSQLEQRDTHTIDNHADIKRAISLIAMSLFALRVLPVLTASQDPLAHLELL